MCATGCGCGSRRKGQAQNELDTDLAPKEVYDLVSLASLEIKSGRKRRLVEMEVWGEERGGLIYLCLPPCSVSAGRLPCDIFCSWHSTGSYMVDIIYICRVTEW